MALFEDNSLVEFPIAVPSRGSSLLARTVSTKLDRATLEEVVLDGFFAKTMVSDYPQEARKGALQEFGLPFAADPVISKHLARFLSQPSECQRQSSAVCTRARPVGIEGIRHATAVLFNGGVFKSAPIRNRVLELLASWNDGQAVRELQGTELDLAVAKGASFYGRTRVTQKGIRIKAGAARSYYIGLENSMPAVPGFKPPVKARGVVPKGCRRARNSSSRGGNWVSLPATPPNSGLLCRWCGAATDQDRSCLTRNGSWRRRACSILAASASRLRSRTGRSRANQLRCDRIGHA